MENNQNKRLEERLCYQWPVLFAEDFAKSLSEGVMVDVSSGGLAFLCRADDNCPVLGQKLSLRFSIPRVDEEDSSAMTSFTRTGQVLRTESINASLHRIAIQFDEPLTLKPCEQEGIELMQGKIDKR
ncbi:MAG: PilZ domain-containing protein [Sedimentisphaerales bacterium]|nr:PilZ domain-containing protein [Sedimentisphaerales bacterium]